jgi:predicted MFS family arabinose efflux permease
MIKKVVDIYRDSFSGLSRNIWLLSLIMLINRSGAMVLPFMSLYLTTSLGFTLSQTGWVMGAYGLGSILGAYIGGLLTDKIGYYYVQLYSLIGSALMLVGLIFIKDYVTVMLIVFLFSTITDTLRPANSVAIASYAKSENRTRSFSLMRFAINLGFSIGPALGGIIAGLAGFKWIFLVDALTCLIAAFILIKFLPYNKQLEAEKKDIVASKGLSAYKDYKYLAFIILVSLYAIAFFQVFTSVPVYWEKEWGFTPTEIGLLLALNGLIVVIVEMPMVRAMENFKRFMVLISLGCVMMIIGFGSLLAGWTSIIPAILFIMFMSFSEMLAMPFMTNYAVSRPTESRQGQYMALYAMAYGIAHVVAPMGSMYLADEYSFKTLYIIMTGLSVVITIAFFALRKRVGIS